MHIAKATHLEIRQASEDTVQPTPLFDWVCLYAILGNQLGSDLSESLVPLFVLWLCWKRGLPRQELERLRMDQLQ